MVEFSQAHSCYIWRCEWGHWAFDFEGEQAALDDFMRHDCRRSI